MTNPHLGEGGSLWVPPAARATASAAAYELGRSRDLRELRARVRADALDYGNVLSRDLLMKHGVDDQMVRREIHADRWRAHGRQTIAVHTGPMDVSADRWRAVWEVGAGIAVVDGVTALQAAGMTGYADDGIHVSVRHTAAVTPVDGVVIHKIASRLPDEGLLTGLPRTRPAIAAVRAATWARTDRQAALLLVLPVQQRLISGAQLLDASIRVRRRARRRLIQVLAGDIANGSQSLGELDFVVACRRRGLPEPTRQAIRHLPNGRVYLDIEWEEARLAVEIDGAGHLFGLQPAFDNLRQNAVMMRDTLLLRVDLIGWRIMPDAYLDQVTGAYFHRRAA